jgi:hypothetical protein
LDVKRLIGYDTLQAAILVLEGFYLLDIRSLERPVLLTPVVKGLARDAMSAYHLGNIATGYRLFENGCDLLFGESTFAHWAAPIAAPAAAGLSTMHLAYFRGKGQT